MATYSSNVAGRETADRASAGAGAGQEPTSGFNSCAACDTGLSRGSRMNGVAVPGRMNAGCTAW
ncbi:hypothetical protein SAMN05216268_14118 [Streptomyces yunnanensis]|uniref:Uncharacterized protein n=1 Tax=Streptomyces yunnanensis TaxID=156453 RepID=A0A9X8N9J1_9ACTN|nr:hypothetical protein SAMN05216268_14118 [Streptomyces yunnanensis]